MTELKARQSLFQPRVYYSSMSVCGRVRVSAKEYIQLAVYVETGLWVTQSEGNATKARASSQRTEGRTLLGTNDGDAPSGEDGSRQLSFFRSRRRAASFRFGFDAVSWVLRQRLQWLES